jgi:hypothetical protein
MCGPKRAKGSDVVKKQISSPTQADLNVAILHTIGNQERSELTAKSAGLPIRPDEVDWLVRKLMLHGQRIHPRSKGRYLKFGHLPRQDRAWTKESVGSNFRSFFTKANGVANIWLDPRDTGRNWIWLVDVGQPFRDEAENDRFFSKYPGFQHLRHNPVSLRFVSSLPRRPSTGYDLSRENKTSHAAMTSRNIITKSDNGSAYSPPSPPLQELSALEVSKTTGQKTKKVALVPEAAQENAEHCANGSQILSQSVANGNKDVHGSVRNDKAGIEPRSFKENGENTYVYAEEDFIALE